jgi:hypothetical protein
LPNGDRDPLEKDPAVVVGDRRVDEVATQHAQSRERLLFVCAPASRHDIRDKDRRALPGLAHLRPRFPAFYWPASKTVCALE